MKPLKFFYSIAITIALLVLGSSVVFGQDNPGDNLSALSDSQKYFKAIHIMIMLLVGFGFLMVFVRKYGRSALTATFLLVSVSMPFYFLWKDFKIFGEETSLIDTLILAEFAAASLLITAGAVLGRLKMHQYIILAVLFVPAYMLNEWIMLDEHLRLIAERPVVDTGGSIVIHAFGALFGLGVAVAMTTKNEFAKAIEADATSDRFSLLGSMVLWVFWPSFCAALVPLNEVVPTGINVILALCGATFATYMATISLRGKINAADIANASLAGGVAIGSVCNTASPGEAIIIGLLAGAISTFGFAIVQSRLQKGLKLVDTCGVSNLHGIPGILGGIAALVVVKDINVSAQFIGIIGTIVIAVVTGFITGYILSLFGHRKEPYVDTEEFADAED
ncbi:MAG: ammonium transporter [Bacteroidota bacterium]